MDELGEFIEKFFDTGAFPPRWYCGKWSEFHGWLYIISDLAIWAAYFTIPLLLVSFIRKKKDLPFPKIFWLFVAFIVACGATHLIDAVIFWFPIYRVSAFVRLITAIASWATVVALYRIIPKALQLRTPLELEKEVALRTTELHNTVARMRFMADAMPQIVWTAKPDGTVDYFNKRACDYTGKEESQLHGWGWVELIHAEDRESTGSLWNKAIADRQPFEAENRIRSVDGKFYWHLTRAIPQYGEDGSVECWVGTATNIEQQKRTAVLLEQMVAERTGQLEHANRELKQSNQDLEFFAAAASHDLQAPLRTVSTYLSMITQGVGEPIEERTLLRIQKAAAATTRMGGLINNLLQFSRVNASELVLATVDLNQIVGNTATMVGETDYGKTVSINVTPMPTVKGDALLIGQLIQNLVINGIIYNNSDTAVIAIGGYNTESDTVITVQDNGIGIAREHQEKIFAAFTRLGSDIKGTGLGLAICKRIMDKHNGTIRLESDQGKGTIFYISFPRS
ncbi:hypothetical protein HYN59_15935 [Flavobacterium album]|uniref:histidine kinase n=1 Tax=Flavobacterium album TaxID=2175091 RepID=A0A2S1R1P7_9FLAO|nr:PAS domain-containing sensor histidine kinase [Flavobacterium album]AWH86506.1 hypothetical protein HYN59_15935 [Flavobacterium album]